MRASDPVQGPRPRTRVIAAGIVRRGRITGSMKMTVRNTLAAGLVALAALAAAPANATGLTVTIGDLPRHAAGWHHAGWNPGWYRALSPHEVRRILRDRGFREIRYLDRRGTIYQVHAVDYRHKHVGLVVSARNGAILTAYRLR
jgi:hypothetical protein